MSGHSRMNVITRSVAETANMAGELASVVQPDDVVLLTGDLGAGKTAFAKGFAKGLGIEDPVTSPTFNILLVHEGRLTLNHFDLYRLEDVSQLDDIDYFGTLESGGVALVEWGDRFPTADPAEYLKVGIAFRGDTVRFLSVEGCGDRGTRLVARWSERVAEAAGMAGEVVDEAGAP